ncbi:MAG: hypothetical protein CK424_07290, partial [Legionella sp.]
MKVLKVLIAVEYGQLAKRIITYLIDAGHFVSIINTNQNEDWLCFFDYNLDIVSIDDVHDSDYDLLLDWNDVLPNASIPRGVIHLIRQENSYHAILSITTKKFFFWQSRVEMSFSTIHDNLDSIFEQIAESFIDSFVFFIRNEKKKPLKTVSHSNERDFFCELLLLDRQLIELSKFYDQLEAHESKFNIAVIKSSYKNFYSNKYFFSPEQLEFFTLYWQTLFNSRTDALYCYDLNINGKIITKCINLKTNFKYSQLSQLISQEVYQIANNCFYIFHKRTPLSSQILINYDRDGFEKEDYAFVLNFNSQTNTLNIKYPSSFYFLDNLEALIDNFHRKWIDFNQKNCPLYDILYHENNYLKYPFFDNGSSSDKTLPQLFEEQVNRTPMKVALVYEDIQLTYCDLNARSNQLAHYLREKYVITGDDCIALCLERSEYMIIAILGVLKAGAAYVPLDPTCLIERLKYIVEKTESKVLISDIPVLQNISSIILRAPSFQSQLSNYPKDNPITVNISNHLAYIIYTSGTTGKPKGVMIEHRSIVNFVKHQQFFLHPEDIVLGYIDYTFDAMNVELYPSLLNGNTIHLLSKTIKKDLYLITQYIQKNSISYVVLPSVVASQISLIEPVPSSLRVLISGGGLYTGRLLKNVIIINQYGLTECAVCTTWNVYKQNDSRSNLGQEILNNTIYLLDAALNPLPIGAIGELYIGGIGVARGYLKQPELTAENFIKNPFQTTEEKIHKQNDRLYITGDLGRYLPDGAIEYIGRKDTQVKIRGYRIECGEIEQALLSYPGILQAVVLVHPTFEKEQERSYLVGYYVSNILIEQSAILNYLSQLLPDYMVPIVLMSLQV